jgi:5-methylthioadenosine/S-adenosylhomocysteine deaminase
MMQYDTIIYNGIVVTVNPQFEIFKKGIVGIKNGKITLIGPQPKQLRLSEAMRAVDAAGSIIMPGLVNTHTHLPMTLFRGLADDLPLRQWLEEHIFPAEATQINPESVRCGSLVACAEMLLSGTTTCCDGYFLEDNVALAVEKAGMRAVVGQGIIDFPAPGVPEPSQNISIAATFVDKWKGRSSLITPSIFCHSPYTCSAGTLTKAKNAADSAGVLFQIHTAETRDETATSDRGEVLSPVAYLNKLGLIDRNTLLVHAVWAGDDTKIIAKKGASISHNPESNMKLGAGIAPVTRFLDAGIIVGLGTDGCASNNDLDMFGEMSTAARLHKAVTMDPTVMDARTVIEMATIRGAEAIGLGDEVGSLEKGKQADLIIIDTNRPHLVPMYSPASHLVYCIKSSDVKDVFVAGRQIVQNHDLLTMDTQMTINEMVSTQKQVENR